MTKLIVPFRNFTNALKKDGKLVDPRNSFQI